MKLEETHLIGYLKKIFNPGNLPGLIGDDAALIPDAGKKSKNVITLDTLVEGTHFLPDTDPFLLGKKLVNVSLSDLAAMASRPVSLLISLGIPSGTSLTWIKRMYQGVHFALKPYNCLLCGGDTVRSDLTVLTSVAIGKSILKTPVYRSGGIPGTKIYVTGSFGYSFETGHHLDFKPRIHEIDWLIKNKIKITSLTDASDGLARSLELLTIEQGLGAEIDLNQVLVTKVKNPGPKEFSRALFDGEDFELVFTAKEIPEAILSTFRKKFKIPLYCIGKVSQKRNIHYLLNNKKITFEGKPFQHF